jgi:hypothetical protein
MIADRPRAPRTIYFAKPIGFGGPVKIGLTGRLEERIAHLSCMSPYRLEVLATLRGDERLERRIHALLAGDHSHGEWFFWSDRLGELIDAINGDTFAMSALPEPLRMDNRRKTFAPDPFGANGRSPSTSKRGRPTFLQEV